VPTLLRFYRRPAEIVERLESEREQMPRRIHHLGKKTSLDGATSIELIKVSRLNCASLLFTLVLGLKAATAPPENLVDRWLAAIQWRRRWAEWEMAWLATTHCD